MTKEKALVDDEEDRVPWYALFNAHASIEMSRTSPVETITLDDQEESSR